MADRVTRPAVGYWLGGVLAIAVGVYLIVALGLPWLAYRALFYSTRALSVPDDRPDWIVLFARAFGAYFIASGFWRLSELRRTSR